jgi:arylformamidase
MRLHDISLTITEELPTWPGDPAVKLEKTSQIKDGDLVNLTQISTSVHMGTHIDAPDHFLGNGETVEKIPLDLLVGPARVIELSTPQAISADDLRSAGITGEDRRLLIKTVNSEIWESGSREFREDFIAIDEDAASYLVECGLEVIGVDYLSVAPYQDPEPTHRILLEAGILIIEGLDLSRIEPGPYTLMCLPLKIGGSDGAPARVLLQEE